MAGQVELWFCSRWQPRCPCLTGLQGFAAGCLTAQGPGPGGRGRPRDKVAASGPWGLWRLPPGGNQARVQRGLTPLLPGPPLGKGVLLGEVLGVHAIDRALFIDYSKIRMTHELCSTSSLGGGQYIRCLSVLNALAQPHLPGTQLPQAPSFSLRTDGQLEATQQELCGSLNLSSQDPEIRPYNLPSDSRPRDADQRGLPVTAVQGAWEMGLDIKESVSLESYEAQTTGRQDWPHPEVLLPESLVHLGPWFCF